MVAALQNGPHHSHPPVPDLVPEVGDHRIPPLSWRARWGGRSAREGRGGPGGGWRGGIRQRTREVPHGGKERGGGKGEIERARSRRARKGVVHGGGVGMTPPRGRTHQHLQWGQPLGWIIPAIHKPFYRPSRGGPLRHRRGAAAASRSSALFFSPAFIFIVVVAVIFFRLLPGRKRAGGKTAIHLYRRG